MSKMFACEFEGIDELINRINKLNGDTKAITQKALKATHDYVTPTIHEAMKKHHLTGDTEGSIQDSPKIIFEGDIGSVEIGFDIRNKGLPSIFLMYGTPKMKKDTKLYNTIYGKATIQAVRDLQQKIFYEELRKLE